MPSRGKPRGVTCAGLAKPKAEGPDDAGTLRHPTCSHYSTRETDLKVRPYWRGS
jgi:hypothetical protein